jgi:hypothetical protein
MHEVTPPPDIARLIGSPRPQRCALVHALLTQVQADHRLLHQQIATLQTRVAELEARLSQHAGNSSRLPSRDPPSAPPRPPRAASGSILAKLDCRSRADAARKASEFGLLELGE